MMKRTFILIPLLAAAVAVAGCDSGVPTPTNPATPMAGSSKPEKEKEIKNALAKLSPEDQVLAEAQRVCPKSGGRLGSMGTPVKLTLKGQPVFICCSSCEEAVEKDPDATLKKVASLKKK